MSQFLRVLGAFGILMFFFFTITYLMNYFAPHCPRGEAVELKPPFAKHGTGVAYAAAAPSLEQFSDSNDASTQSNYLVCENGYALGPAHVVHAEIAAKGKGRFSHWTATGFVFSAADNSDPNTNGRKYRAVAAGK
jgi:hypothetical protein